MDASTHFFRLEFTGLTDGDVKNMAVVSIIADKNYLGFVVALEEIPLSRLDCIALEHAATVIALEMLKQKAAFETELRLRKDFLEELFAGKYESEDTILWRADQLGLDLSKTYRLMTIENMSEETADDVKKHNGHMCMSDGFFETVDHALESVCSGLFLSGSRKSIIGLLPVIEETGIDEKELSDVLQKLESGLKTHLPEYGWLVGIGSPCSRLQDFVNSYQEARSTIEIAKALNCKNRCVAYEKLGIFSLININIDQFREFIRRVIGPLIDYDKKHQAQLIETLKLYFDNNFNLQRAARNGFLTSATIKYRLRRIKEIANIDLTNSDTILRVHMTLKLIEGI